MKQERYGEHMSEKVSATERIYEDRGDVCDFDAAVLSCERAGEGYEVVLDRTAFFPGGGGQVCDTGTLIFGSETARVISARMESGVIRHMTDAPVPCGVVKGKLDSEKRLRRMQNHSGEHIVSGLAHSMFGCNNVGFHISEDAQGNVLAITVDTDRELTAEQLEELESAVNSAVWRNIPIIPFYPTEEELASLPYRSKKELSEAVRLVSIDGVDLCACCAPHLPTTGGVGIVKIIDSMRYKGGMRLTVCCGSAALDDYRVRLGACAEISALISVKQDALPDGVRRLLSELDREKKEVRELRTSICDRIADTYFGKGPIFELLLDAVSRRYLAPRIAQKSGSVGMIFSGSDGMGYDYTVASDEGAQVDLRALAAKMRESLGGSGGGNDLMINGRVTANRAEIEEFCTKIGF